ncbi:uncharacterized protein [Eleutherodactylus coqui]|uniref:uncharacterized protein n=1 Tax=Eleutherodactylus coqui TaxID=57060 RepID=UPI0034632775
MDPPSAGLPLNKPSEPVQTQPQWQNTAAPSQQPLLYNPRAVVLPGLQCLVEVEEVTLNKKAFVARSGQTLFTIRRESECCGPSFHLKFQDPYKRDVVSLYMQSGEDCCGGDTRLMIIVLPANTIGFVKILTSPRKMNIWIERNFGKPVLTAELPLSSSEGPLEIFSVNGSCPVAKIIQNRGMKSTDVIFQFPMDMEATLKTAILATYLYMRYQLTTLSSSSSSSDRNVSHHDDQGAFWSHEGFDGHCDSGGFSGDCGGGGSWDCGDGGAPNQMGFFGRDISKPCKSPQAENCTKVLRILAGNLLARTWCPNCRHHDSELNSPVGGAISD